MTRNITSWILRLVAAIILLQTLYFKFTAAPESVAIFTQLGMEPWGRILVGIAELIAAILLLVPRTAAYGGILGLGVMSGAIMGHITKLGFEGEMFSLALLAVIVFACCAGTLYLHRMDIPLLRRVLPPAKGGDR